MNEFVVIFIHNDNRQSAIRVLSSFGATNKSGLKGGKKVAARQETSLPQTGNHNICFIT